MAYGFDVEEMLLFDFQLCSKQDNSRDAPERFLRRTRGILETFGDNPQDILRYTHSDEFIIFLFDYSFQWRTISVSEMMQITI
ncbi:hypothetical protein AB6A40_004110 [Gnathostoma spinigerum]|uniref:Uncharacterized protein n=1 Tax=Gnathostoma spinigerum TaxID=75299 RepID=A0ABD6EDV3_9BILA